MEFAEIIQESQQLMEYCILGKLVDILEDRLEEEKDQEKRAQKVIRDIHNLLAKGSVIHLLGSFAIGLATSSSDVDLYIDQGGDCFSKALSQTQKTRKIEHLCIDYVQLNGLEGKVFKLREIIVKTRVPILRLQHLETSSQVDVSSANGLGVRNSHLLRMYLDSDVRVKWLVRTVHEWAKLLDVVGPAPYFRPYALTWLVTFFLMQTSPPVLFPLAQLQVGLPPDDIAGWDCRFPECHPTTNNTCARISLLIEFLEFMTSLNFEETVISPLSGELHPREMFKLKSRYKLPQCFLPYLKKADHRQKRCIPIDSCLCIQDPIELNHNITAQVHRDVVGKLIESCRQSLFANRLLFDPISAN